MMAEHASFANDTLDPESRRKLPRHDSLALIQGLERLRECIELRLAQLEAVATEQPRQPVSERTELELRLQPRIQEIEEAQNRLRAQAERRDQEWRVALEQLEGDRTLLAEAWEQLERERLEGGAASTTSAMHAAGRVTAGDRSAAPPARTLPELADPVGDHVAHAILQQFQTLRNDVRRNARQRGSL